MNIKTEKSIINFSACDINPKQNLKPNAWKAKILIGEKEVEIEIYEKCNYCGQDKKLSLNKEAIGDFINLYPPFHDQLVNKSKKRLSYLANELEIWKNQIIEPSEFEFIGLDLKSFGISNKELEYKKIGNHRFEQYFILNGKENENYKDVYGLWVVDYQGEMLQGISRRQT